MRVTTVPENKPALKGSLATHTVEQARTFLFIYYFIFNIRYAKTRINTINYLQQLLTASALFTVSSARPGDLIIRMPALQRKQDNTFFYKGVSPPSVNLVE